MKTTNSDVDSLCKRLHLGTGHELQERAVVAALRSLLVEGRRGVVLADEVGFGKTYEALAVAALLAERARQARKPFERVLILCKSALLQKWQEELSPAREPGRGFLQYLTGKYWPKKHPFHQILDHLFVISRRATADDMTAIRVDNRNQARPGIYIVNQELLTKKNREARYFLKRLYSTIWDPHHRRRGAPPRALDQACLYLRPRRQHEELRAGDSVQTDTCTHSDTVRAHSE